MQSLVATVIATVLVAMTSAQYGANGRFDHFGGNGFGLNRGYGRGRGSFQDFNRDNNYFDNSQVGVLPPANNGFDRYDRFDRFGGLGSQNPLGSQLGGIHDPFDNYNNPPFRGGLGSITGGSGSYRRVKRSYGAAARSRLLAPSQPQYPDSLPVKTQPGKSYVDGLLNSRYPTKSVNPVYPGDTFVKEVPVPVTVPVTVIKEVPVPVAVPVPGSAGTFNPFDQGLGPQGLTPLDPLSPEGSFLGQGSFPNSQGFLPGSSNVNQGPFDQQFGPGDFPNVDSWVWPDRSRSQPLLPARSGFSNF